MALTKTPIELSSTPGIVDNSNATAITIDASENVSIGVTNPSDYYANNLVVGAGSEGGITIASSATTYNNYLAFADGSSSVARYAGLISYDHNINDMHFRTNSLERMRLTAAGDLYFGQTAGSSTAAGHIIEANGKAFHIADGNNPLHLARLTSDGDVQQFYKGSTLVGSIGTDTSNSDLYIGNGDTAIMFHDGADAIFPHNVVTNAGRDAAIDIGYSTYRFKDLYLSGGAYLGGTAAANKLTEYESGTWTPTIPGCTITVQRANYVKIGGLLHLSFTIAINSTDNSSNQIQLNGVPFAGSVANTESTSMYMASYVDFPTNTIMSNLYNYSQAGVLVFYVTLDNGGLTILPRSALSSSSTLWGSIVTQTDD